MSASRGPLAKLKASTRLQSHLTLPGFLNSRPLRVAVVGAGAVGLYYGAQLAKVGCDVHFLVRSGFEEAKSFGIRVYSPLGDMHLRFPKVFRTSEEIGPVDLVLVSIKATANSVLEKLLPPLLAANSILVTLQNGLGNEEFLTHFVPPTQILGALCFASLTRESPATVHHYDAQGRISIGEFSKKIISSRVTALVGLLVRSGIQAGAVPTLIEERWRKLVWNIPFNGLSVTAGGVTVDRILAVPQLLSECKNLMEETVAAANALGMRIELEYPNLQLNQTYAIGPYRPSTLVDFQAGKELEIEAIWGIPLRRAESAGIKMPHLSRLYKRLCELNPKTHPATRDTEKSTESQPFQGH